MSETDPGMRVGRRRKPRVSGLTLARFLSGIVVFAGLALLALSLSGTAIPVPGRLIDRIESRLNAGLDSGRVDLGRTSLVLEPGQPPQVLVKDIGIFVGDDTEIARLDVVRTRLAPRQLLRGIVAPSDIRVSGARVALRANRNGESPLSPGTVAGDRDPPVRALDSLDIWRRIRLAHRQRVRANQRIEQVPHPEPSHQRFGQPFRLVGTDSGSVSRLPKTL